jgi:serine phosphatase RsbU (regulator of sigma subunit)
MAKRKRQTGWRKRGGGDYSRPLGVPDQTLLEHQLDFLYRLSQNLGAMFEERSICKFVIRQISRLLGCKRASIMLYDAESGLLRISASVGIPKRVVQTTGVKPGEHISGRVFVRGRELVVGPDDSMPADSLGVRTLASAPTFMSVPLITPAESGFDRQILGVINLTRKAGASGFGLFDRKLVHIIASHTAAQIRNCRLMDAEQQRRKYEQSLKIAADIQLSLLPSEPLTLPGFRVAGLCRPAQHVGGDFFDYWVQDRRVCMLVADVMGHDVAAALLAADLRSIVRAVAQQCDSASGVMFAARRAIAPDLERSRAFIAVTYLELDLDGSVLSYCRCGQPEPLLLRRGRAQWLDIGCMPLGVENDTPLQVGVITLEKGDLFVAVTDGVLDVQSPHGGRFGREGLLKVSGEGKTADVRELAACVVDEAQRHGGGAAQADDLTVLVGGFGF